MKKSILSLAALAAFSATLFTNDRTEDYTAAYRNVHFGSVNGVAAVSDSQASTRDGDYPGTTISTADKLRGVESDNSRD